MADSNRISPPVGNLNGFAREQRGTLFQEHHGWLRSAVRALGVTEDADDIVQGAFVQFSQTASADDIRHPRAILLRIATNIFRDNWRRSKRREHPGYRASLSQYEPSAIAGDQFERVFLQDIVRSLPPLQREVFVLSRFGGKSHAEIAVICGISIKAVEARMAKALVHCSDRLRD